MAKNKNKSDDATLENEGSTSVNVELDNNKTFSVRVLNGNIYELKGRQASILISKGAAELVTK
jgi:hypothetical protein